MPSQLTSGWLPGTDTFCGPEQPELAWEAPQVKKARQGQGWAPWDKCWTLYPGARAKTGVWGRRQVAESPLLLKPCLSISLHW